MVYSVKGTVTASFITLSLFHRCRCSAIKADAVLCCARQFEEFEENTSDSGSSPNS